MSTPPHEQTGDDLLLNRHSDAEETLFARMIREGKIDAAGFFREKIVAQRGIMRMLTRERDEARAEAERWERRYTETAGKGVATIVRIESERDEARGQADVALSRCQDLVAARDGYQRRAKSEFDRAETADSEAERLREGLRAMREKLLGKTVQEVSVAGRIRMLLGDEI